MSDRAVIALAVAVCAGAWLAWPVPRGAAAAVLVAALALRRPGGVVLGGAVLAASLGAAAWAGLEPPGATSVAGHAVVVRDPVRVHGAVRAELRLDGRRVEAWARGSPAAVLRPMLTGEVLEVAGRLRPLPDRARRWLAPRHVAATLDVIRARPVGGGALAHRAANALRRRLDRGAADLEPTARSLLLGVVLGDEREQPDALADDFRAAGLTHLLAVSGQNVAYVLLLASPLLARLGPRGRWITTLALVGFFGLLTRWEPSVLRAGAMAALACTASTVGRPASRLRLLSLAVAVVVLVDPLLVHALGFRLSVGATAGIALLAAPLAARLPGPRWLAEPLAVTAAAQAGVAPVAIPAFSGLPVASLAANLLAGPAAGPLTVWGLTGGLLAGVAGDPFDGWLHVPTSALAGWLAAVASWSSALPLGRVRGGELGLVVGLVVLAVWARARGWRRPAAALATAAVLSLGLPALRPPAGDLWEQPLAGGATVWRRVGAVVVLADDPDAVRLGEALRQHGIARIDLLLGGDDRLPDPVLSRRVRVRAVASTDRPGGFRVGVLTVSIGQDGSVRVTSTDR